MPAFFVPFKEPHETDVAFETLAAQVGYFATLPRAERLKSLMFTHNGEVWTAEVGKRLYGRCQGELVIGGMPLYRECETSDAAVVLAIFPGAPYVVMTDGGQAEGRPSRWSSRFTVSRPVQVTRIDGRVVSACQQSAAQDITVPV